MPDEQRRAGQRADARASAAASARASERARAWRRRSRRGSPADASSAASRSTSAMIRAFSAGGGSIARRRDRQRLGGDAQLVDLGAAGRAGREVRLVAGALVVRQRAEDVGARRVLPALVIRSHVHASTAPCASASRIFFRPSRIRPFTVPTGDSSISAISTWVKPPK